MATEAQQIKQIMEGLDAEVESAVRHITTEIVTELKTTTPIDTGFARASWIPSIGSFSVQPVGVPGFPGPAIAAQTAGLAALLTYKVEQGPVYIVNNSGYIGEIVSPVAATIAINQAVANVRFLR